MSDLDFLDGFDSDIDWGFTTTDSKPSETKDTEAVAKSAANEVAKVTDGSLKALESKLITPSLAITYYTNQK